MSIKMHKIKPKTFEEEIGMIDGPPKKNLPRRSISIKDLPEAKDWKNGEMYEIHEVVKQVASDENGITVEVHRIGGGKHKRSKKRFSRVKSDD